MPELPDRLGPDDYRLLFTRNVSDVSVWILERQVFHIAARRSNTVGTLLVTSHTAGCAWLTATRRLRTCTAYARRSLPCQRPPSAETDVEGDGMCLVHDPLQSVYRCAFTEWRACASSSRNTKPAVGAA
ncbi:hypothetical protein EON66_03460 [archaeon]|nr:MAG: hypothetical protein EON66_03460 [archaeon]